MKIRDKERLEPPHVTVMFRAKSWIVTNLTVLRAQWDAMYPENPIALREAGDD